MSSEAVLQSVHAFPEIETAGAASQIQTPLVGSELSNEFGVLPDEQLLSNVVNGSAEALGVLFRRHGRVVLNVARRVLQDDAEAADLRQDVFLYVFQRACSHDATKSSVLSWILQITYHRAIDRRRFLTSRQHYNVEEYDEGRITSVSAQLPVDQLDAKALLEKLRGQLTLDQQRTLELHFFEGYSLREIAEKSGQSLGNVRHHYYRALERLRSNLFSKK